MSMRQTMKRLCLLTMLMSLCISIFADEFEVDGIKYRTTSSSTVEVSSKRPNYSGDIIIPEVVTNNKNTYSVTSIGYQAFSGCSSLASVTIPNSVTSIGSSAFEGCSSLTSVTIPNSVESIGYWAFHGCSRLASVTIPNSVTSIGERTFYGCSSLASVTIGNSVTSIGYEAFSGCSSLASVTIPNSVTSIGYWAFRDCSSLASVTIPNSVTSIGSSAFEGCSSLTSVTIPNSVESIESDTFRGCSSLTSVTIGNSVTSIGSSAFEGCSSLTSVAIPNSVKIIEGGAFYECNNLTSVTIGNSVTSIGSSAFEGCSSLTSLTIPNSVTSIGKYAFSECNNLTSLTIGNSVTSIGSSAFEGCSSLTSVTIPNSMTSIGGYAFYGCGLTSVTIPNSVTDIGEGAFEYCSGLTSVTIPNSVTSIGGYAFYGCSSLASVTIGNSVTSIGYEAFSGCSGLASVTIPNSVTSIGGYAFKDCTKLTIRIELPNPIQLQNSIFNNNAEVSLEVPIGSTVLYAQAEYWSDALKIYALNNDIYYYPVLPIKCKGESIVSISGLFDEGIELSENETIEVLASDEDLLAHSLVMKADCEITDYFTNGTYNYKPVANYRKNIISTYSYPYKEISLSASGTLIEQISVDNIDEMECLKVSGDINGTDLLTIRKMKNLKLLDLSDAHIVNGGLSYYKNYTTSENTIGEYFYEGLNQLLRIKLPNDIHTIKKEAFKTCESVVTIKIPSSIKKISNVWMLIDMKGLQSIQIDDIEKWCLAKFTDSPYAHNYGHGIHLFLKDEEVFDLIIPEGVTEIPGSSFYCCGWLESVKIPSTVKEIGAYSFEGCSNLTSVTSLNTTPPHIEYQPFSSTKGAFEGNVEDNATLYVPKGCKTIYWLHPLWENFKNIVELEDSGVNNITVDPSPKSEGVYTIDGVKLSANADNIENLRKGIYIINGEKVVIK